MANPATRAVDDLVDALAHEIERDAREALLAIGDLHRRVADLQCDAARAVAREHSWSVVGQALGVSRQAAHQRYCEHLGQAANCGPAPLRAEAAHG
jgi:hypothetical protein